MSANCERCKGSGWLERNKPGPEGWPDDSILSARRFSGYFPGDHIPFAEGAYCAVCPCTIEGGFPNTAEGTAGQPDIYRELADYLEGKTIRYIGDRGNHTPNQIRIRLTWIAHRLQIPIPGTKKCGELGQPYWYKGGDKEWWLFPE